MRRTPRAIGRAEPLGHNALTAEFAGVREQDVAVAFKNFVHDNPGLRTSHQFGQLALALFKRRTAQIFAVQFDQIKR
jgi:hypothetical protein